MRFFAVLGIFVALLFVVPVSARAESVLWTNSVGRLCHSDGCNRMRLDNVMHQISYNVRVVNSVTGSIIPSGSTVSAGTSVRYEFIPHQSTDVYWFGTGGGNDSPNGDWVADAGPMSEVCVPKNFSGIIGKDRNRDSWADLIVAPPTKTITGLPYGCTIASDGASATCVFSQAGTVNAQFRFAPTTAKYYAEFQRSGSKVQNKCGSGSVMSEGGNAPYMVQVPQQNIMHMLTVGAASGGAPWMSTLSSNGACVVGASHTITMSATDPDGDQIRYGVEWDAHGSVDEFVPPTGYVSSGTNRTASRTYATAGQKVVKVLVQDEKGNSSAWTQMSFRCSDTTDEADDAFETGFTEGCMPAFMCRGNDLHQLGGPQCTDETFVQTCSYACSDGACLLSGGSTGSGDITVIPQLVRSGGTTRVSWTTERVHVDSCLISENNPFIDDTASITAGSFMSSPILQETTYTLSCVGENGNQISDSATVNIAPTTKEE